jgi:protein TonB
MFEQSMLIDHAAGKRTGALAASVTVQTLALGGLLAIPLLYSDRLPVLKPWIPLSAPLSQPPPAPKMVESTAPLQRGHLLTSRAFVLPTRMDHPLTSNVTMISSDWTIPSAMDAGGPIALPFAPPAFERVISVPMPRALPVTPVKEPAGPVSVGGDVQAAKLIRRVIPPYPPLAKQARISGTVRLVGVIAKDGTIQQLQLVSGHPLLVKAALDAVRQWSYQPTLLNGQAVEVIAPIDVIFTLSQ